MLFRAHGWTLLWPQPLRGSMRSSDRLLPSSFMIADQKERRDSTASNPTDTWKVLAIYEDAETRRHAVEVCDKLMKRFWGGVGFDVAWEPFESIENAPLEASRIRKAAEAYLVLFATHPQHPLPAGVKTWIEGWIQTRGDREGVLVGLHDPGAGVSGSVEEKYLYLRNAAHRGGLDYLTELPEEFSRFLPDSVESYSARADVVTSVLNEILRQQPAPPTLLP